MRLLVLIFTIERNPWLFVGLMLCYFDFRKFNFPAGLSRMGIFLVYLVYFFYDSTFSVLPFLSWFRLVLFFKIDVNSEHLALLKNIWGSYYLRPGNYSSTSISSLPASLSDSPKSYLMLFSWFYLLLNYWIYFSHFYLIVGFFSISFSYSK